MLYDVLIVGGGPGGYHAAQILGGSGLSVCLFEKRALGGVCLNEGCIPSKTYLHSARLYAGVKNGLPYGVTAQGLAIDMNAVFTRKEKTVKRLRMGIAASLNALGVNVVNADARIMSCQGGLFAVEANEETYLAPKMILAAGSVPALPPIDGLKEALDRGYAMTSTGMLDLRSVPDSLVVIGGGVIGLELADCFAMCGSKVTVVEMLDHIGGSLDGEISQLLAKELKKTGMEILTGCAVKRVTDGGVVVENNGEETQIPASLCLVSVGRRPASLDLSALSQIPESSRGYITADAMSRSSVPGIYAVGDITGRLMLAHSAYKQAEAAAADIIGTDSVVFNADIIPSVIYTSPETACVGFTAEQMAANGWPCTVREVSMNLSGRYMAENERGTGVCKLIFDSGDVLVGCHIIGDGASEIIACAGVFCSDRYTRGQILASVFPHPSISEIIKEAAAAAPKG